MKLENMDNWPKECAYSIIYAINRAGTRGEGGIILVANPKTIKALDTLIGTLPITYRQCLLMSGLVAEIIENYDDIVDEDEASIFQSSNQKVKK